MKLDSASRKCACLILGSVIMIAFITIVVIIFTGSFTDVEVLAREEEFEVKYNPAERVICHYSTWSEFRKPPWNYNPEDLPLDVCTHIVVDFVGINKDSYQMESVDVHYKENPDKYNALSQLKSRYRHLKVMFGVGGWQVETKVFSDMVSEESRRARFVKSAVKWIKEFNYDGIDILWQYPANPYSGDSKATDRLNLVSLAQELSDAFEEYGYVLSVSVPLNEEYIKAGYNLVELSKYVNWFSTMGFDLRGQWDDVIGVHGTLFPRPDDMRRFRDLTVERGIERILKVIDPSKVVLGIAFHGRTFVLKDPTKYEIGSPADKNSKPFEGEHIKSTDLMSYYEVMDRLTNKGWAAVFDQDGKVPYAFKRNQWVGYENEKSIEEKMKFALTKRLSGIMIFNTEMDDFLGQFGKPRPLISTVAKKLGVNIAVDPRHNERLRARLQSNSRKTPEKGVMDP